ncbi:hypothetical protein Hanom_Chr08g00696241 [Helianthus anomalus]
MLCIHRRVATVQVPFQSSRSHSPRHNLHRVAKAIRCITLLPFLDSSQSPQKSLASL